MNRFKLSCAFNVFTAITMLLFSCNSGEEKKTGETVSDSSAVTTPMPAPTFKPWDVMIIQHKVSNFEKWKPLYESHDSVRQAYGLTNFVLGRGVDDSNMVLVFLKMADAGKAKELSTSQGMKDRMQKAGVTGAPSFKYLHIVMLDTTTISQSARLMVTHKVKDWDAWKKEFDDHKQARTDAGLIDRGLGYSADDNHMVTIVFAVNDMQKATAFLKSDDLKNKMAKAGVEGPPTFLFYNVVQKY